MTHSNDSDPKTPGDRAQPMRESTGIDAAMIDQLVRSFYGRVRQDPLIGPIFDARITDWEPHLQRMCSFWSSLVLSSATYQGNPMRMHMPLPIEAEHFDRWLALFEATARDLFSSDIAARFIEPARRVAMSLELGVASSQGVLLGRGQRYRTKSG